MEFISIYNTRCLSVYCFFFLSLFIWMTCLVYAIQIKYIYSKSMIWTLIYLVGLISAKLKSTFQSIWKLIEEIKEIQEFKIPIALNIN